MKRKLMLVAYVLLAAAAGIGFSTYIMKDHENQQTALEGRRLAGLYISRQGMAAEPYYTILFQNDEAILKRSTTSALVYQQDEKSDCSEIFHTYFQHAEELYGDEAGNVKYRDSDQVQEILQPLLEAADIFSWDGYHRKPFFSNASDRGTSYQFYCMLEDGTQISFHSPLAPEGFEALYYEIRLLFEQQ